MQYTEQQLFRLPQNTDPALIGDINYNFTKLDPMLVGSGMKVGLYSQATSAESISLLDTVSTALGKLEYKANEAANVATLNGYVAPPAQGRVTPLYSTDTILEAFTKLMVYINDLERRIDTLETNSISNRT